MNSKTRKSSALPAEADNPAPDAQNAKPKKKKTSGKPKLVRDSFTMPQADFVLIAQLKARALGQKHAAKKSEILRAALHALSAKSDAALLKALSELTPIKPGRPKSKQAEESAEA